MTTSSLISSLIIPGQRLVGRVSEFGGPLDRGVAQMEGLALYEDLEAAKHPDLFLTREKACLIFNDHRETDEREIDACGLARRLDPKQFYCAMRWNYKVTPRHVLRRCEVEISPVKPRGSVTVVSAKPVDWGPHEMTGRIIDVSPAVIQALQLTTDDRVFATLHLPYDQALV